MQVGSLIFPIDFTILNFDVDLDVLFILRHPLFATEGTFIDSVKGKITMQAHDKVEVFDVYNAMKLPTIYEELVSPLITFKDPLKIDLVGHDIFKYVDSNYMV